MPMPRDGGRDFSLARNQANGLYDLVDDDIGGFASDDTETHTVLSLLTEYMGKWWADQTGKRGSTLHLITNEVSSTTSDMENAARDALARASARIELVEVKATRDAPGKYTLLVSWRNRLGHIQNTRLSFGG